jgi:predicted dehydrogenase
MSTTPIRVAVVGVGSFGKNHARVYHALQSATDQSPAVELTGVVDQNIELARAVAAEFHTQALASVKDLLATTKIDAASVAVPTVAHLATASALMEAGVDVLIEKPLTAALHEADELIRLARRASRIVQVGHLERFNPAVRATLPIITRPMFFEIHRLSQFTPRSLDVDVVLDLMIHDLDVVLSMVNSPVKEVRAVGLPVLTNKVDIANVRMEFDSGCVANFTASRVSTERVRKLRFFQPHQYVSVDYSRKDVFMLTVNHTADAPAPGGAFTMPDIVPSKPEVVQEEPLHAELKSFLNAVATRSKPVVTLEDGRRALSVALDILASIEKHSRHAKLDLMSKP